jgi:ADP-heptose:LPS heptosyltransferase
MDQRQGILVIRLKSLGDILFTLPAVHALRSEFPEARITFLVSKEYSALLDGFPGVASIIELDRARFRGLHPVKVTAELLRVLHRMRSERLRLAVDLQGYGETAFFTRASGAPERWAIVHRSGRRWAYTRCLPRDLSLHPAAGHLALLRSNGLAQFEVRNEFVVPSRFLAEAEEFFAARRLRPDRPTMFIQPFTSDEQKNWPLARYLEIARRWQGRGWQIVFGGGPSDRAALEVASAAGLPVAAGASLLLSAGLAKLSTLILGGDTGLLHLGVAMGKRVVMLMRYVLPGGTFPFQHPEWAVPAPGDGVVASLSVETVEMQCARAAAELGVTETGRAPGARA